MANTNRPNRKAKRIPVSGSRDILTVEGKDPNFKYSWVNDTDNMLARFQRGGYQFVDHAVEVGQSVADSSEGTSSIVSKDVGKGVTAYLMRIPMEFYEEDQRNKHKRITEQEDDMRRMVNSGQYGKVDIS